MTYGITGNTTKDQLWEPAARLVRWMIDESIDFCMTPEVADGLLERLLLTEAACREAQTDDLASAADIILSFGGDGTFLHTARQVADRGTPILGVNIGRLGFLAGIETEQMQDAVLAIESGRYVVEDRSCIEALVTNGSRTERHFALNEFVIERSGRAGLVAVDVDVNDVPLNNYWADGIIISTPTGSTAYSLSVGGPIVSPGAEVFVISPIASHSLTVRPIVLEDTCRIHARIDTERQAFVLAGDGASTEYTSGSVDVMFTRADFAIRVVRLEDQHYFDTLRNKLMWGLRRHRDTS